MDKEIVVKLAAEAFEKYERVRMLGMANTPQEYEDRKAASIAYAISMAEAHEAQAKLGAVIRGQRA